MLNDKPESIIPKTEILEIMKRHQLDVEAASRLCSVEPKDFNAMIRDKGGVREVVAERITLRLRDYDDKTVALWVPEGCWTVAQFKQWMSDKELTCIAAARALGCSEGLVKDMRRGKAMVQTWHVAKALAYVAAPKSPRKPKIKWPHPRDARLIRYAGDDRP